MAYNQLELYAIQYGFSIEDVAGNGDCFFHAMYKQMRSAGLIQESLEPNGGAELRRKLVYYLVTTNDNGGFREEYEDFFSRSFERFINELMDREWADHFAIRAFAHMWNISIKILDNMGCWTKITPRNGVGRGREISIGYIIDEHYVALGNIQNSITQPQTEVVDIQSKKRDILRTADLQKKSSSNKRKYQEIQNNDRLCSDKGKNINKIQSCPHTPIEVNASNEKKKITPAESQRAYKAKRSNEMRGKACEVDRQRKAAKKQLETVCNQNTITQVAETEEERREQRLLRERIRIATFRASQTEEEREQRLEKNRTRMATARAKETNEEREQRLEQQRIRLATKRAMETNVERELRREQDRLQTAAQPDRLRTHALEKIATKTPEILQGLLYIPNLSATVDRIGEMSLLCIHCGAMKFKRESYMVCCGEGKVLPPTIPTPPKEINDLWLKDTAEARFFRANSRSINNAVCLSSISVEEKHNNGFSPSVIFQGRVIQRMGPLLADSGEQPRFAQLYVLDSNLESTTRFANMHLPKNMNQTDKNKMKKLLNIVQNAIHQHNPYVQEFKQVVEFPYEELENGRVVISASARPENGHARIYNAQTNQQELSVVTNENPHNLVLHFRGGGLKYISDLNSQAMPLHFTLLFINGTPGWHTGLKHTNSSDRITPREFFAFHMNVRNNGSDFLFQAGRLYQEWILTSWITCENQKLKYMRFNQNNLRADSYKNLCEAVYNKRQEQAQNAANSVYEQDMAVGRFILPSTFIGSVRWYLSKFQDAMAIVRHYTKPTLFITMTTNPHWPEIQSCLAPGQTAMDRPDVVARVFKLKKDQLMNDITKGSIFGKVLAHLWVIEFQKRGLPHVHILIILANEDRPKTPEQVDNIVCAELPPDPSEDGISEEEKARRQPLWDIVLNNMIHGPCGAQNPTNVCMEKNVCTKKIPKQFQQKTVVNEDKSYPVYRRRSPEDGGGSTIKGAMIVDNSWVVPYNPYLSLWYNCHCNVEICISPTCAKYLYKYVTKGPDRAMVSAEVGNGGPQNNRDEITEFVDMRSCGSSEAAWHMFAFSIAENKPPVKPLRLHLENQQQVYFVGGNEENIVEQGRETELTAFFQLNAQEKLEQGVRFDPSRMPRYIELPQKYTFKKKNVAC